MRFLSRRHRPPRDRVEHPSETARGGGPAASEQPSGAALHAADRRSIAQDRYHQRKERQYWRRSLRASWAAAGAAVVAVFFAAGAFFQARRQADTAQDALSATDRPWIRVDGLSDLVLEVTDFAVFLHGHVRVQNVGHSPAQHTFPRYKLLPDGSAIDEAREAEALCRDATARGIPFIESLIFPDAGRPLAIDAAADLREIAARWRDRIERDYAASRAVFGDELARKTRDEKLSYPVRAAFTLVGCVTYVIPAGRTYGQTAFINHLNRDCGLGPHTACTFEMTQPGTYAQDALVVREGIGGAFAC